MRPISVLVVIPIPGNLDINCTVCGQSASEAYSTDDESVIAIVGAACRKHQIAPRLPCARPYCQDPECRFDHGDDA